jgi:hypothetical protein
MRLLALAWLGVLAACVNAWMLGPTILFHSRTLESEPDALSQSQFTDPENLFRILRDTPDLDPVIRGDLNTALPVLALLWALAAGVLAWRLVGPRSRALALCLSGVLAALVLLILDPSLISSLPEVLQYIQFPYRLLTYADFCVVGLVTLALAGIERQRSSPAGVAAVAALAAIALFNLGISIGQNSEVRSWLESRDEVTASKVQPPPTWYAFLQFGDGDGPVVEPTLPEPLTVPVEEGVRDSYRVEYPPGPAGTAATNIATGNYLVDVAGAEPVGNDGEGIMIVRLPASPQRPRTVVVSAEDGPAVAVSRLISVAALVFSLAAIAAVLIRRRRAS